MENILSIRDTTLNQRRGAEWQGEVSSQGRDDMCDHNFLQIVRDEVSSPSLHFGCGLKGKQLMAG